MQNAPNESIRDKPMSTFGKLLKDYRERADLSQSELSIQAGLSASTISRIEKGERGPLRKRSQIMALAKALGLKQAETDILLSAADLAPSTALELFLHPRDDTLYRIAQELEGLRTDSRVTPAQIRFVEEALLLILRGARSALPSIDTSVVPSGAPSTRTLSEEERYLDDLLGDFIAGKPDGALVPFTVLSAAARSPHWELKRRLAEALPALLAHVKEQVGEGGEGKGRRGEAERILSLIVTLRQDPPDPEWRTDIRRRVIEAMPALWQVMPQEVAPNLRWREGDEVYAALATLDVLSDIGDAALIDEVRPDILAHVGGAHRRAVTVYAEVLDRCTTDPDAAIQTIVRYRDDDERLVRICMARPLHRLLEERPAETLKMMRYVLRQESGKPVEHQNVRRAVARASAGLIALLDGPYDESALNLLRTLVADRDIHIRRAFCDALAELVERFPDVALDLIEAYLLQDRDRFVHERTWNALRHLMNKGSERAEELCARMIEIA
jgi:transcriptional regulator with XRE-family HTH domain